MGQSVHGKEGNWKHFHSFGTGGTFGSYGQVASYNEQEGGCDGVFYNHKYYEQNYGMATFNYHYTQQNGYISQTYGGSIFVSANVQIKERFMIQAKYINYYFRYGNISFLSFELKYRIFAEPKTALPIHEN